MTPKEKYEKWGFSPYPQGSYLIYQARMFNKIKEKGDKPSDEEKEKVKKDWESMNLFQRQVYIADQSEEAVKKRQAAKEEAN